MRTVLIVDDSRITRRHVARLVQAQGYETIEAANGLDGLAMVESHRPDGILLDILMPEMDGIRFLKEAELRAIPIPVIVMSADAQTPERAEQLRDLGAQAIVDKPPRGETQLVEALRRCLASS